MDTHTIEAIAEIFSWVGLGIGIPLTLYAWWHSSVVGTWTPEELAVVDRGREHVVRWYADGEFRERPLRRTERRLFAVGTHSGFRAARNCDHARLLPPSPMAAAARTVGLILLVIGAVSLVASFVLPLL